MNDEEDTLSVNMALICFLKLMIRRNNRWFSNKKHIVESALDLINNPENEFVETDENGEKLRYNFYKIFPKVDGRITDISENS